MDTKQKLPLKSKISYGLGAVGKDMVYMLSASYVLYYFQDVLGVSAVAMGVILLAARIFDAFNDPIMGVVVAKTKTRWGKFRPWLLIGTLTNAVVLFLMFSCPPTLDAGGLVAYAAVTYTMMDIPYWSMIPAFTEGGKEREGLTTLARSCAGVGSALITVATVMAVQFLGNAFGGSNAKEIEILGFKWFSAIVAVLFIVFTILTCVNVKEKSTAEMKTVSVGQMFKALLRNDQALAIVLAIVLINSSIYITSNLVIYFFKYDFGGTEWFSSYTLFNIFGGAMQILSMMVLYPVLRNAVKLSNTKIFYICLTMSMVGYAVLLVLAFLGMGNVFVLFIPGFLIFAASGLLNILTTIFLANTVDYGELKNGSRDESVIFSLQTFVVKLASGIAAFVASICLSINKLQEGTEVSEADKLVDWSLNVSASARTGLRLTMTVIPIVVLVIAILWFRKKYILTDEKVEEIAAQVKALHAGEEQ